MKDLAKSDDLDHQQKQALNVAITRLEPRLKWFAKHRERDQIFNDWMDKLLVSEIRSHTGAGFNHDAGFKPACLGRAGFEGG